MTIYIITGGPNSGKTSVLNKLQELNYLIIDESAKTIIKNELLKTKSEIFPPNTKEKRLEFQKEIILDQFKQLTPNNQNIIIMDRFFIDSIAYLILEDININKLDKKLLEKITQFIKNNKIIIIHLELLDKKYFINTEIRIENYEFAKTIDKITYNLYIKYGFNPIIISKELSIKERTNKIIKIINSKI